MPKEVAQSCLLILRFDIQKAIERIEPLNIPSTDVTVFFPADQLEVGLGEELIAQVEGLYKKPERTPEVLKQLQEAVCNCLENFATSHLPQCTYVEAMIMQPIEPKDCSFKVLGKR
jgi:hypothetical protein